MSSRTSLVVELEAEPAKMTLDALRQEYVTLKTNVFSLTENVNEITKKIEALRAKSVNFQLYTETQEESITNRCIRNLDDEKNNAKQWNEEIARKRCELRTLKQEVEEKRKSQILLEMNIQQKKEQKLKQWHEKLVTVNDRHNKLEAELLEKRQCYLSTLMQILANIRKRHEADLPVTTSNNITTTTTTTICSTDTDAKSTSNPDAKGSTMTQSSIFDLDTTISNATNANTDEAAELLDKNDKTLQMINNNSNSNDNNNNENNSNASLLFANKVVESLITPITVAAKSPDTCLSSPSLQENIYSTEQRINKLIKDHKKCTEKFNKERNEYDKLVSMLKEEDQAYTLLRGKAAKIEEDLHAEQHKLEEINTGGLVNSSFGDSSFCTTPNHSLDPFLVSSMGYSLRERTRELLSTPSPQVAASTATATATATLEHAEEEKQSLPSVEHTDEAFNL